MLITVIRLAILYCVITVAIRLMGKRQVGEMQPTELVVTILLSELVAIPIQDNSLPMATSLISCAMLIGLEIIGSLIAMRNKKFREFTQGNSIAVIEKGRVELGRLRDLRLSMDDLLEALRQKDVFDISEVETCMVETNGQLSVQLKPAFRPLTAGDLPLPGKRKRKGHE
ncbi:MAG: DUF421 domain-containing protein [Oscillospiraceae bacterium]|jgi:uncharacterized membrane protein YcaP (DUF421 family)|nr:DUF421 domain-containing protein [Oscillospiraceae bacterium]